ncbi:hypothetical protein CVT24_001519 [Panaeolus cyanescens]|uniref:Uncharacterized protein n=1 Tax=Panaeolus cyanescens TaxID=181874 RepID=A0A409YFD3_9AGAR|nr:hypothetical protein CVT24_001519 [Panaeolus cyanescens]
MSLDKNLFTLLFTPHKDNPNVTDLVDPLGNPHYRKQRVPGPEYKIEVYDFVSESLLATASAPSASSKVKTIELHNPSSVVELKFTGTLSFRWSFKWEEHEFEWKREECFIIRKPDPPVIIAVTKEPAGRLKTTSAQILDYNLNRFDINDRKGLEIVVLTALLTFQDGNEAQRAPQAEVSSPVAVHNPPIASRILGTPIMNQPSTAEAPPPPPPKPPQKTGVDRIAELQAMKGEYNEIIISEEGSVQDYASYCSKLLEDDAMLFITVKSAEATQVPKVLQVVEETKRIRHKAGLSDDEELYQYVLYDTEVKKGPKRINLDDGVKNKYAPPQNLVIHLSKISMPELQPKAHGSDKKDSKKKDDKKASTSNPARPAPPPPSAPSGPPPPTLSQVPKPPTTQHNAKPSNKLQRPGRTNSPNAPKVHAHQVHPNQPSPSPSQLNNPSIYAAPPPGRPRPQSGVSFPQPWAGPTASTPATGASLYASAYGPPPPQSFPPQTWTAPGPPPPPPTQQPPQPMNPAINAPASKPLSASNVVHGLFDFINSHRK